MVFPRRPSPLRATLDPSATPRGRDRRRLLGAALAASVLRAARAGAAPAARGPSKLAPTAASLASRPFPRWFGESKFGIFVHWGVYSVPSWAPKGKYAEWYWRNINDPKDPRWAEFHARVYGKGYKYQDFAPQFRAELFDPNRWADLFAASGARYVVLTSKHHDGYCLWPSAEADRTWGHPWTSATVGPKRDLVGELGAAVRAKGLKYGLYYSLYEWYNPLYKADFARFRDAHYFPQIKDLVRRYQPSLIFADGQWDHTFDEWKSGELLAWLFNDSGVADLVVNDRWAKWGPKEQRVGYLTTEYGRGVEGSTAPWEENRGIGASFGYNRNEDLEDYRTAKQLVRILVEMVSKGGNLLLDVGPTADGRIPVVMQERLVDMGRWVKANGEAIYGTTAGPLKPAEKDRLVGVGSAGHAVSAAEEARLSAGRKWFTTAKPGKIYVHVLEEPGPEGIVLPPVQVKRASLLVGGAPVRTRASAAGLALDLPRPLPDPLGTVIALETA
jgi:alpha-L-fucosidase